MTQVKTKDQPNSPKQALRRNRAFDNALRVEFFKALSDPTRLMLLACLTKCGRECSLSEIAECCQVDFSVVSRHMAQLAAAGIVEARKEGRAVYYVTNCSQVGEEFRTLAEMFEECGSQMKEGVICGC